MNLDKFAADVLEALLKDLRDTFPSIDSRMIEIEADLYGWKVARAEALADRLKQLPITAGLVDAERSIAILEENQRKREERINAALRDHFAGQALASEFEAYGRFTQTSEEAQQKHREHVARQCYLMPDPMLAARNPEPQPVTVEAKT